ncbi:MAG: hypothetical protein HYX28_04865 [Candidatus Koribacter versatilis]|uniref:Uncharacterized protein n=1 Tax=Candidatus Korobacter versatilis TaxID=658062 RepID=A0A932ENU5_9BACT|nr:hypothetical protein [Candidatus Koribacter versatilis]
MLKRLTAVLLLLFAAAALAQAPAAGKKPNPGLRPDAGAITAGVYHNRYFGFDYQLPAGFDDRTSAMPKDGRGITFALLYISEPKHQTRVARSVTLLADDAIVWKSKDGAAYLDKVNVQMQAHAGLVGKLLPLEIAGHTFYRQDYQPHAQFLARQTIVATVIKGYVLSAVLTAGDAAGIDALLAGVRAMKFNPAKPKTTTSTPRR